MQSPDEQPSAELAGDGVGNGTGAWGPDALSTEEEPIVRIGPGGIDDPDTRWDFGEAAADALPLLEPGQYLLLEPGEDAVLVEGLPKARRADKCVVMGVGELALCDGRQRAWLRTPAGESIDHPEAPLGSGLVVVFIAHRAGRRTNRPRRYVAAVDESGALLAWLDYSDTWPIRGDRLEQMTSRAGLLLETERFLTEVEFEEAHPDWVA